MLVLLVVTAVVVVATLRTGFRIVLARGTFKRGGARLRAVVLLVMTVFV